MLRPALRRTCRGAVALTATTGLLMAAAAPAAAQTTASDVAGATQATALRLTLNLPGGEATRIVLELDPVTGTVSRSTSTTATSDATVLRGSLGGQGLDSGTSSAKLPEPTSSSSNPAGAIEEALAGTPLANLLKVELLPSSATVSGAPTSEGEAAVANLGAGLPDALADALAPLTGPLADGVDQILTTVAAQSGVPVGEVCTNLTTVVQALAPVTGPLDAALGALPITVPAQALLDETVLGAICGLSTTITQLNTALQDALASLTGDSGVLGTGLVTSTQDITSSGAAITAVAESSIAGLTLLGQTPFASAEVLRTTSTAKTAGTPGTAAATVDSTVANLTGGTVDPFLQVRATIQGIRDSFVGEGDLPAELEVVFDELFDTLNAALAPVGITLFKLDDSADAKALSGCPAELDGLISGTFAAADGSCAAAATRGVGLSVTLPAALAGPLGIAGPLVELQIVPTAAVVRSRVRTVVTPAAPVPTVDRLPRTGLDGALLGTLGVTLLVGAAVLRRRRATLAG